MVASQQQLIIDTARAKKLPTMFPDQTSVAQGALASYGLSYHTLGRLSAKYVQCVLQRPDGRRNRLASCRLESSR
jgi:ABC-type uncharacterized transport system substrate-binding protein